MAVLTEQEVANPGAAIERLQYLKDQNEVLAAQIKKDGENLYADAKKKCAKELEEIKRREDAIAPQEAQLREREGKIGGREASVGAKEMLVKQREETLKERSDQVNARDLRLRDGEIALAESVTKNNIKNQQETSNLKGERLIFEQQQANAQEAHRVESENLREREAKVSVSEAEGKAKKDEIAASAAEIEQIKKRITGELGEKSLALETREAAVSTRSDSVSAREQAVEARAIGLTSLETSLNKQKADQDQLQRGLEKSKLDIEVKDGKVSKRENLVNALIEAAELKSPGFRESLSKIEGPDA